jgi:hypothetical protein
VKIRKQRTVTPLGREEEYSEFQVLRALIMNSTIFYNITLCNPVEVHRRFGGKYGLQLQERSVSNRKHSERCMETYI